MSLYRLSNSIFDLGLNAQEMTVYAYLCSLPADFRTLNGMELVKVKQVTIGQNCGLRSLQTVAKVLKKLIEKKLIEPQKRERKRNGQKGTYTYAVKKLPTGSCYFLMERRVFGELTPSQMLIYLFLCKAYSPSLGDSWNSYNDISEQTGIKRESVVQIVQELIEKKLIVRSRRRSRDNNKVYVDNHYWIVQFGTGVIKRKVRLQRKCNRTGCLHSRHNILHHYNSTLCRICQEVSSSLWTRGSPSDVNHYSVPKILF